MNSQSLDTKPNLTSNALSPESALPPLVLDKSRPVHFIGAGGVGMSALAKVLLSWGYTVSGSDAKDSSYLAMLTDLGGKMAASHQAEQVPENAIIIASTAIRSDNPEIQEAQRLGLPIYHRSDLLKALLERFDVSIGLTGTHGKTTLTGMVGMVLEAGQLDPTIIAGGKMPQWETNARTGANPGYGVAELDESDGTIVKYHPTLSVIANLELDHPDHYQDGLEAVKDTFRQFLRNLTPKDTVIFNMDCPNTHGLFHEFSENVTALKAFTTSKPDYPDENSYYCQNVTLHQEGGYQGDLYQGETLLGNLWLQLPGQHNLWNAMHTAIIGHRLGIPFDIIRRTLENFTGMGRRFEQLGTFQGARIIDDYAHHPTEVVATLKAAREFNQQRGRVIALFQPHRYQRLKSLWDEFLTAFEDADEVIVVDVYGAGESPMEGVDSKTFATAMNHPSVDYWPSTDWVLVEERLKKILTPGDLLITLGAGDITQVGRGLVKA